MNKEAWLEIVDHQVDLLLGEMGLRRLDLTDLEISKYRLEVALKLLEEMG